MRLLIGLAAMSWLVLASPAHAQQSGPAAVATQHALEEQANCLARRGDGYPAGYCPTETPVPTATPRPAPTSTPVRAATTTPVERALEPVEPSATPQPVLPAPARGGDAVQGYTRPLADGWLELALTQGRWAVLQADDCAPQVAEWTTIALVTAEDGEVDLTSGSADCGLVAATWQSDAPCAVNDDGVCDLTRDDSFLDYLGSQPTPEPTATPEPAPGATKAPAPVVITRIVQAPAPPPRVIQASAPPIPEPPTPEPRIVQLVQTVVVYAPTTTVGAAGAPTVVATATPWPTQAPWVAPTLMAVESAASIGQSAGQTIPPPFGGWWFAIAGVAAVVAIALRNRGKENV